MAFYSLSCILHIATSDQQQAGRFVATKPSCETPSVGTQGRRAYSRAIGDSSCNERWYRVCRSNDSLYNTRHALDCPSGHSTCTHSVSISSPPWLVDMGT